MKRIETKTERRLVWRGLGCTHCFLHRALIPVHPTDTFGWVLSFGASVSTNSAPVMLAEGSSPSSILFHVCNVFWRSDVGRPPMVPHLHCWMTRVHVLRQSRTAGFHDIERQSLSAEVVERLIICPAMLGDVTRRQDLGDHNAPGKM